MRCVNKIWLLVSVIALISILFFQPIYFSAADDPRYIYLLSGVYTGSPCAEVVFIGYLFSTLCSWLYSMYLGIEWYTVIFYGLYLLSYTVISWHVLKWKPQKTFVKYVVAFSFFVFQIYLLLIPQNTILSIELSFASLVVMLNSECRYRKQLYGILLFFIGTQIRFSAAFIPYMIACPLFLCNFRWNDASWWKNRILLAGLIVVAAITFFTNKSAYSGEQWKEFNEYNEARGFLADNPIAGEMTSQIASQENRLAYDLFYRYRIFDWNILTLEKIKNYKKIYEDKRDEVIRRNIRPYMNAYRNMEGGWVLLVLVWVFFELLRRKKYYALINLIIVIALFLGANLFMMSTSFPKERVLLGSLMSFFFAVIYISHNYVKYTEILLVIICLIWGYRYMSLDYSTSRNHLSRNNEVKEVEQILGQCESEKVMLPVPTQLVPEVFHTSSSLIGKKSIIQGWLHIYPKADLSYQPFTSFVEGLPLLVKKNATEQIDILKTLLRLHYNINATHIILKESENYYLIRLLADANSNPVNYKSCHLVYVMGSDTCL